jgi:glycosyltransferase involved in cell wall biosynthesis
MNRFDFPKVVIGVCTHNRCNDLKRLLQSLMQLEYQNFKIIVVDNNSIDKTAEIVAGFEQVKYIFEGKQGLANARNCLLENCDDDAEYLGMLDDDETVDKDWILRMLECFQLDERIAVVGGPYIPYFEVAPPAWMPYDFHAFNVNKSGIGVFNVRMAAGGNAMLRMDIVRKKKLFFDLSLGYNGKVLLSGEDNEFFVNIMGGQYLCGFTEYASVKHYITKERMTFKWFVKRYFYEGVTQYHRFGTLEYLRNFLQLPLRIVRLLLALFAFNKKKIIMRFFKVVMTFGTVLGPLILALS